MNIMRMVKSYIILVKEFVAGGMKKKEVLCYNEDVSKNNKFSSYFILVYEMGAGGKGKK